MNLHSFFHLAGVTYFLGLRNVQVCTSLWLFTVCQNPGLFNRQYSYNFKLRKVIPQISTMKYYTSKKGSLKTLKVQTGAYRGI